MMRSAILLALLSLLIGAGCGSAPRELAQPPIDPDRRALLAEEIEQLTMAPSGSCAILTGGRAHCFGEWGGALLKLGMPADSLQDARELRIGSDVLAAQHYTAHLCVRDGRAKIQCWGNGHQGQLGLSKEDSASSPLELEGLPPVAQLALGDHHTCALTQDGGVICWGSNEYGQLGLGKGEELVRQPSRVPLPAKATQIAAAHFTTCALTEQLAVLCWGENLRGEAGSPNSAQPGGSATVWTPRVVAFAGEVAQLSAAFSTVCAVKLGGKIACWGYLTDKLGPSFGRLTQGEVPDLDDAASVAVGYAHACALRRDGSIWCWGTGAHGAIGDGRNADAWRPQRVELPSRAIDLVAGERSSCARLDDRRWFCWGDNRNAAIAARDVAEVAAPILLDLAIVK